MYSDLVKGGADIENETIALDAEMHADLEQLLLEEGYQQNNPQGNSAIALEIFSVEQFICSYNSSIKFF